MIRNWIFKANALSTALTVMLAIGYMVAGSRVAIAGPEDAVCANFIDNRVLCGNGGTTRLTGTVWLCHASSEWYTGPFGTQGPYRSCCVYEVQLFRCFYQSPTYYSTDGGSAEYFRNLVSGASSCSSFRTDNQTYGGCLQN